MHRVKKKVVKTFMSPVKRKIKQYLPAISGRRPVTTDE